MFNKKPPSAESVALDQAIVRALTVLDSVPTDSKEYVTTVDQLTKLNALKDPPSRVSKDTLLTAGANLLGILVIVGHERANVVTSKAIGFIGKTVR